MVNGTEALSSKLLALRKSGRVASLGPGRNLELYALVVVSFTGGGEVEVGEQDFAGAAAGKIKQGIADDRVVDDVRSMSVLEHEHCGGLDCDRLFGRFGSSRWIAIRIIAGIVFGIGVGFLPRGTFRRHLSSAGSGDYRFAIGRVLIILSVIVLICGVGHGIRNIDRL